MERMAGAKAVVLLSRFSRAGTQPYRLRWFRAFFESEAAMVGAKGAPGFTTWVDRQTLDFWVNDVTVESSSGSESEPDAQLQHTSGIEVFSLIA